MSLLYLIHLLGEVDLQLLPNLFAGVAFELEKDSLGFVKIKHRLRLDVVDLQALQKNFGVVVRSLGQRFACYVVFHWNFWRIEVGVLDSPAGHVNVAALDAI